MWKQTHFQENVYSLDGIISSLEKNNIRQKKGGAVGSGGWLANLLWGHHGVNPNQISEEGFALSYCFCNSPNIMFLSFVDPLDTPMYWNTFMVFRRWVRWGSRFCLLRGSQLSLRSMKNVPVIPHILLKVDPQLGNASAAAVILSYSQVTRAHLIRNTV